MRRWPRISASSFTPPSDSRTNLRPSARAIDLPSDGLAHAGRPDEAEQRALHLVLQLAHGQVLDDALLDLLQAVVVLVEDPLRLRRGRGCPWSACPRAASTIQSSQLRRVAVSAESGCMRSSFLSWRSTSSITGFGILALCAFSLSDAISSAELVALAELALDRLQLLAQEELALATGPSRPWPGTRSPAAWSGPRAPWPSARARGAGARWGRSPRGSPARPRP